MKNEKLVRHLESAWKHLVDLQNLYQGFNQKDMDAFEDILSARQELWQAYSQAKFYGLDATKILDNLNRSKL